MFVLSVKSSFLKKAAAILSATAILTVAVVLCVNATKASPASKNDGVVLKAATHNERISFLSQFGWQINEDPLEVTEVLIPAEFDETYTKYNQLQKDENGLDLSKYSGRRVKRWTYEICNYPGYENTQGIIRANLLVYDGRVIGGDVCSIELNGFMQGFGYPEG